MFKLKYYADFCWFDWKCIVNVKYLNQCIKFNQYSYIPGNSIKKFEGVTIKEMSHLEKCFNLKIDIVSMNSSSSVNVMYKSLYESENIMYLDNYQNHLSYITNYSKFANKFQCEKCNKMFKRQWDLKRHYINCYERVKYIFLEVFAEMLKLYLIN